MMKPTSLFNSASSFSQQQPGFGSTAPTSTMFGNQQQKPFGFSTPTTVTSAFGAPAFSANQPSAVPTFGGGGSLFGAQTTTTSSPGFPNFAAPSLSLPTSTAGGFSGFNLGGNTSLGGGSGGGFSFAGSNAFQPAQAQGTSIPFNAITGTDTMMKNSVQSSINTRHQCITCMKEYEQKSLEELRLEDYQLGRKGSAQQPNSLFRSTQAQPTGLFSSLAPATNTTSTFGQQQRPPPFGATTTQSSGGGLFANINLPKPNFFGSTPTTGFAAPTSNSFSFNSSQPQSLFQTTQPATTGTMGNQGGFGFTQPTQQQSVGLNAFKPMVAPVATSTPFGGGFATQTNPAMSKPNLFTSTTSFNQQPNFGTTAPTSSIFGMQSQKPFGFNTPATVSSAFGPQTFSTNPTQTVAPFGTSGSIFGPQTTTTASTGFPNFAAPSLSLPTSTAGGFSGFNLGGNTSLGVGSTGFTFNTGTNAFQTGSMQQQQQQQIPSTGPVPFATTPYKDSPLFYNLITNRNLDTMTKPTNPVAQRAVKEASRRRSSTALGSAGPSTSLKQFTYPVSKTPVFNKTNSLFDGFEDDDRGPVIDILSPKTSVKKLSLKTVRNVQRTSVPSGFFSMNDSLIADSPRSSTSLNETFEGFTAGINNSSECPNTSNVEDRPDDESFRMSFNVSNGGNVYNSGNKNSGDSGLEGVRRLPPENVQDNPSPPVPRKNGVKSIQVHEFDPDNYVPQSSKELDEDIAKRKRTNKCGVICTLPGYYIQPAVHELDTYTDDEGNCFIRGFCVGRYNYGQVRFLEAVNVAGLNIDEIVKFRHKEIVVYPDDMKSPPVGQGLNVRSQIRLERIWPVNKLTREPVTNPAQIRAVKYEELLRKSCERMDATFISYDEEAGVWSFLVKHFSKYSCVPEEDDEDPELLPPAPKMAMTGLGGVSSAQLKKRLTSPKQKQNIADPCKPHSELYPELSMEFAPIMPNLNTQLKLSYSGLSPTNADDSENSSIMLTEDSVMAPRSLLRNIFFPPENSQNSSLSSFDETGVGKPRILMTDTKDTSGFFDTESDTFRTLIGGSFTEREKQMETMANNIFDLDETVIPPLTSTQQIWQYHERQEVSRKPVPEPLKLFQKLWTASTSISLPPRNSQTSFGPHAHFIQIQNNAKPSPYVRFNGQVLLNRIDSELKQKDHGTVGDYRSILKAQLEIYFENSLLNQDDTFMIDEASSSTLISIHAEKIQSILTSHPNLPLHHTSILKEEIQVWKLIEILWPNNEFNSIKDQMREMNQRSLLSKWMKVNGSMLFSELFYPKDNSIKGLLLKGMKHEACHKAFKTNNPVLALCLAQNNPTTQRMIRTQLESWEREGVLEFIEREILQLYGIAAGFPIWGGVDFERMSTSEWLQHFATFLWYLCPVYLPIQEVVQFYQATIRDSIQGNCDGDFCAPHPDVASQSLANICIHLIKMYSCVGYPVSKLLSPNSHSTDHFNYKISWFLMNTLRLLGIRIESNLFESVTTGFATQLEGLGMWEWTIFVLKFLPSSIPRDIVIRRILEQNLTPAKKNLPPEEFDKKVDFLKKIGMSTDEINDSIFSN